jgi:hypothetical protein
VAVEVKEKAVGSGDAGRELEVDMRWCMMVSSTPPPEAGEACGGDGEV